MAGKKDPSIYDDRSTIGSEDELDEYGVWVKSEPQDLSNSVPNIEELPDFDDVLETEMEVKDFDSQSENEEDQEEEDISFDSKEIEFEEIPENLELPEGFAPTSVDGDGFTEVSMTDFLDSSSSDQKPPESIDFGDLDSSVPEIEPVESFEKTAPAPSRSSGEKDLSTQLLQRIADELSSIKKEISSLKSELSVVRSEVKGQESADSSGFFDEEDDEKIALTGDELDNILNTANFTEETGSGESETVDISFDDDLSELDGAIKVENEVKIPESEDFDISLDLTSESTDIPDELDTLREEGAIPITEAPEDTSYLEEDPLASFSPSMGETDLAIPEIDETFTDTVGFSESAADDFGLPANDAAIPVLDPSINNISIDLEMEETEQEIPAGPDDFIFETEETMEIPSVDLPDIEEDFPAIDSAEQDFAEQDLIPETDENLDFSETVPKGLYDQGSSDDGIPNNLKQELKIVLSYMDQLLESLPEDKIEEFAKSEYFDTYKKLFEELGLV